MPEMTPLMGHQPALVTALIPVQPLVPVGIVLLSALLATVPDIDHPNSWLSRHVRKIFSIVGALLGAVVVLQHGSLTSLAYGVLLGGIAGGLAGWAVLWSIHIGSGGHRHLTHSLLTAGVCALLAVVLWRAQLYSWALAAGALAWSIPVHISADVPTPNGVMILWPLSRWRLRVLPAAADPIAEPLVAVVAALVGVSIVWTWA